MAELPMPHHWPTALQATQRCLHNQGFVFCVNKCNDENMKNACHCVHLQNRWGHFKSKCKKKKTIIKLLWLKIYPKRNMTQVFKTAQSGLSTVHWHSLQCIKSGVTARKKPRKHRMHPRLLCADHCEYYEKALHNVKGLLWLETVSRSVQLYGAR